ncbi:hypothetical protein [Mesorhizobium sp. B2-6-5]|uniref:hypothetical protein n=1 Tax=Mesorhizobium sp. B2-6-5 TaxID=2589912 RepID=UPI001129A52B|nr:hypothetical protein [Mesorhizobium sp. B2-6-5]TPJ34259.1 hypothetical protein FJ432_30005 [Mesorhizobium sp. B2-6-5]
MNIQTIIKSLRGGQPNTADQLRQALDAIDIDGLEKSAELLETERRRVLLDGSDKDLEAIEAKISSANRDIERAYAAQAELSKRLDDATAAASEAELEERYRAAKAKADAATKLLSKTYPEIAKQYVTLLKAVTEAEIAVSKANECLPAGAAPIVGPEFSVRGKLGEPEKTIKSERVAIWCYDVESIQPLSTERQADLNARYRGQDRAVLEPGTVVVRRNLIRRTYLPATHIERSPSLSAMDMPGLAVGDPPFWIPSNYTTPAGILARLEEFAAMKPRPAVNESDLRIEYIDEPDNSAAFVAEAAE